MSWSRLLEHAVDLLKGETLGLRDEEVAVDEANGAEGAPDEEDLGAKVALVLADHVGSDDRDDAVPEPVGGGGETHSTGANGDGEDLADDDPGAGAPGGREEEDVDADEGDKGTSSVVVVWKSGSDCADDELTEYHAECTPDEEGTAAETLDGPEGDWSRADVHDGEDQRHQEGVFDCAEGLEEDCGVVEDEVHAGPLLHHPERWVNHFMGKFGEGRAY